MLFDTYSIFDDPFYEDIYLKFKKENEKYHMNQALINKQRKKEDNHMLINNLNTSANDVNDNINNEESSKTPKIRKVSIFKNKRLSKLNDELITKTKASMLLLNENQTNNDEKKVSNNDLFAPKKQYLKKLLTRTYKSRQDLRDRDRDNKVMLPSLFSTNQINTQAKTKTTTNNLEDDKSRKKTPKNRISLMKSDKIEKQKLTKSSSNYSTKKNIQTELVNKLENKEEVMKEHITNQTPKKRFNFLCCF